MNAPPPRKHGIDEWVQGIRAGDRAVLGQAITLVESTRPEHEREASALLAALLPFTGGAHRVGITGAPGAGKSTLIEALGTHLTAQGRRVAVLAVDPSSALGGGSLLGDKTRMTRLASDPHAFVRPSPSGGRLGGVARKTREAMLVCEAAGFDVVLVETVGVGQSEVQVASMVDCFVLLLLAGAGDELQGIKRGIVELADLLLVTKADGPNEERARAAAVEAQRAARFLRPRSQGWQPVALPVSALSGEGIAAAWEQVLAHRTRLEATGAWETRRSEQSIGWMWSLVREGLESRLRHQASHELPALERAVAEGRISAGQAAEQLLSRLGAPPGPASPEGTP